LRTADGRQPGDGPQQPGDLFVHTSSNYSQREEIRLVAFLPSTNKTQAGTSGSAKAKRRLRLTFNLP
jgi:hypothetical protein